MKELNGIYDNYPKTPEEFPKFKSTVVHEIEEVKERFKPNPIG